MSGRGRGGRGGGRGGRGGWAPPSGAKLFLMRSADECGFDSRNLRSIQDYTRPVGLYPDIYLSTPSTATQNKNSSLSSIITSGNEILRRMRNSSFYYQSTKDYVESIRYPHNSTSSSSLLQKMRSNNDKTPNSDVSSKICVQEKERQIVDIDDAVRPILACTLQGQMETELGLYIPEELVSRRKRKMIQQEKGSKTKGALSFLDNLEAKERHRRQRLGSLGSEPSIHDKLLRNIPGDNNDEEEGKNEDGEEGGAGEEEENVSDEEEDYLINYYESEADDYDDDGGGKGDGDDAYF